MVLQYILHYSAHSSLFSRDILYYDNFQQPGKYVPVQTPFGGFDFGLAGDREI